MNEVVTISRAEYESLRAAAVELADLQAYDAAKARLALAEDEVLSSDVVDRLLAGESPVRVYRQLRGLTQAALAARAGVGRVTIAEIETGRKTGSLATVRRLALALGVAVDDLVS